MLKLEIIEIGEELGILLPAEMIEAMSLKEGSILTAIPDPSGLVLTVEAAQPGVPSNEC